MSGYEYESSCRLFGACFEAEASQLKIELDQLQRGLDRAIAQFRQEG